MEERKRERIVFDKFQSQFCRFLKEFSLEKWKLQLFCDLQLDQHVKKSSSMNKGFNHFSPSSFIPQFLHGVRSSNETFCQMEKKSHQIPFANRFKNFFNKPMLRPFVQSDQQRKNKPKTGGKEGRRGIISWAPPQFTSAKTFFQCYLFIDQIDSTHFLPA